MARVCFASLCCLCSGAAVAPNYQACVGESSICASRLDDDSFQDLQLLQVKSRAKATNMTEEPPLPDLTDGESMDFAEGDPEGDPQATNESEILSGLTAPVFDFGDISESKIVFVDDKSGSMGARYSGYFMVNGQRYDRNSLCNEFFKKTIQGLSEEKIFDVITFARSARPLFSQPVKATDVNRQTAVSGLLGTGAGGGSNLYAALRIAYTFDVQAIYVVFDGMPNNGYHPRSTAPQILGSLSSWDRGRNIPIKCNYIGAGRRASQAAFNLCKDLASRTGGTSRNVS